MKAIRILTVERMRAVERAADSAGVTYADMMEAAGKAVADAVASHFGTPGEERVAVLAGSGNNGGDGLVAAHYLASAGVQVSAYLIRARPEDDPLVARLRSDGVLLVNAEDDQRWRVLRQLCHSSDVLVDAVLGTGITLPVQGVAADVLGQVGKMLQERERRAFIVAVDIPSGMDSDTGQVDPVTLDANLTVTMAAAKPGHFTFPGAEKVGELTIADIGIPDDLPEFASAPIELATRQAVHRLLPRRPRDAHKGTFGRVLVVGGSVNYTGAPYLAGAAAYRTGAGLVTLAVPLPLQASIAALLPDATWLLLPHETGVIAANAFEVVARELPKTQALLLGPGLGLERETRGFVSRLLRGEDVARKMRIGFSPASEAGALPDALRLPPTVVDADGLKHLAEVEGWPARLPEQCVLTPHPGEMAVLTRLSKAAIQADRLGVARRFAAEWGKVVVLKGAFTVVAAPDGRATVQPFATPALARAGTGDVLAGAIAGLMAQGLEGYDAAVAGCFLHGTAGELAAADLGATAPVTASDVLRALPRAMAETGSS